MLIIIIKIEYLKLLNLSIKIMILKRIKFYKFNINQNNIDIILKFSFLNNDFVLKRRKYNLFTNLSLFSKKSFTFVNAINNLIEN